MTNTLTRFAPSPNGLLHLGHVYAAQEVWRMAAVLGAKVLLRIENTDFTRCKPEFEDAIVEDLAWLGFEWTGEIIRQSDRKQLYDSAISRLKAMGVLYPCICTRKDIEASWGGKPQFGPEGMRYRGTCRGKALEEGQLVAWRLDMSAALARVGSLTVNTVEDGILDFRPLAEETGDVVLVRKDIGSSYHLAVTLDDADQGISHVVRGEDMRDATAVHRVLQSLLGLPVPTYHFHPLIMERDGRKLAKREGAEGVRVLKEQGYSAAEVLALASGHWSLS